MEDIPPVRLLLDANIYLEILLDQEQSESARTLLAAYADHEFFLSDFSLHSIVLSLFRRQQHSRFREFLTDALDRPGTTVLSLDAADMEAVVENSQRFGLDFDDAYQYTVALKYDLTVVSLDSHFDRTDRGRKTLVELTIPPGPVVRTVRRPAKDEG